MRMRKREEKKEKKTQGTYQERASYIPRTKSTKQYIFRCSALSSVVALNKLLYGQQSLSVCSLHGSDGERRVLPQVSERHKIGIIAITQKGKRTQVTGNYDAIRKHKRAMRPPPLIIFSTIKFAPARAQLSATKVTD